MSFTKNQLQLIHFKYVNSKKQLNTCTLTERNQRSTLIICFLIESGLRDAGYSNTANNKGII